MIRHVVMMKFTDPSNAAEAKARLEALPPQIPELLTLWVGLDIISSEFSQHLVLISTHDSVDSLRGYQGHRVHQEFSQWVQPLLTSRAAVDAEL